MKQIDKLISTSFIGPAILSYFIATFVLIMMFLWKYIDEILGKGLSILEIQELIFYHAVTLIPMAVPITVLISSVMVFGDMAEKYELSSMKSAGVSLLRVMWPSMVIALGIGLFSILAANFLKPASLLQFNKRFIAIKKQKSALAIEQGIFNDAFNETIIRVDKIDDNKRDIHDVLIYDHTPNDKSLIRVTSAKGGKMYTAMEGKYFVMELDTGISYQEDEKKQKLGSNKSERPFTRMYFDKWSKTFDMSVFEGEDGLLNFNRDREQMMNSVQLINAIDSFSMHIRENNEKINNKNALLFTFKDIQTKKETPNIIQGENEIVQIGGSPQNVIVQSGTAQADTAINSIPSKPENTSANLGNEASFVQKRIIAENALQNAIKKSKQDVKLPAKRLIKQDKKFDFVKGNHFINSIDSADIRDVMFRAQGDLSAAREELLQAHNANQDYDKQYQKYQLRLNQQYSWAMVCIIFLFIGAPLGSIIRKGGYGYPLLVAIMFYMIFIISTIYGEKLVRSDAMSGIQAAWMPCLMLTPWVILFTIMAIRDISFNPKGVFDYFYKFFRKKQPAITTENLPNLIN
ncbi:MAG: LptF/LptG family permease [Saprospiraceae bacterium]|nr:LptF/LptG family permease [Saprospiraceae bacterium]